MRSRAQRSSTRRSAAWTIHPWTRPSCGPPHGVYVVGFDGDEVVAGGGLRALSRGRGRNQAHVRTACLPLAWRGPGLLGALEDEARRLGYAAARLDTGPKQVHGLALYRSAGYVDVPAYNDNPFACFWGEKALR